MSMPTGAGLSKARNVVHTANVDEAREVVTQVYLPHRLDPIGGARPLDMRLDAFQVGSMTAGRLTYGSAVRLRTVEASCFHVNVPLRGHTLSRCGTLDSVATSPRRAAVFVPDRPADIRWDADCEQLCLMVPTRAVELELEHLLGRPGREPVVFSPAFDLSSPAAQSWCDGLQLLAREFERQGGLAAHPLAGRHVERLLLAGLLLGQPNNYSDLLTAGVAPAGRGAFGRAVDLLEQQPERDWSTSVLASEVFVSGRTLQEAFRREIGQPPMTYLRHVRLRRVHDALAAAAPGSVTVGAVAARWGFLHLGRFAGAYRAAFGVSPSETLRRR
jgi:AraC-like DNA-binding protein